MIRELLERYINLEPEDGREALFEYTGNRGSFAIGLSHKHLLIGASVGLWEHGEPIVMMHLGPLVAALHLYPDVRSEP